MTAPPPSHDREQIARLNGWVDDMQLSARIGVPHYKNPSELKADIRWLLSELERAEADLAGWKEWADRVAAGSVEAATAADKAEAALARAEAETQLAESALDDLRAGYADDMADLNDTKVALARERELAQVRVDTFAKAASFHRVKRDEAEAALARMEECDCVPLVISSASCPKCGRRGVAQKSILDQIADDKAALARAEAGRDAWRKDAEGRGDAFLEAEALLARERERANKLEIALRDEFMPLVQTAHSLADRKDLASAEVARAVSNVLMWMRAALAVAASEEAGLRAERQASE